MPERGELSHDRGNPCLDRTNGISCCRICGANSVKYCDTVEFYVGYAWPIYDCGNCGCRFTSHDGATYDFLYSEKSSCYNRYAIQADDCKRLFDRGDLAALRAELSQGSKYRFIIEEVDRAGPDVRILEIGSSRGHLTSYFILAGRAITGVDVSPTAVAASVAAFGEHFVQAEDPSIDAQAPYDIVFHVGTIGCVSDPVGMTNRCLNLLKSGGRLLFNSPNRDALSLNGQTWFESAPPPDVVTLYPSGFWCDRFSNIAVVSENVEVRPPDQNLLLSLRRLAGREWRRPMPMPLSESEQWSMAAPSLEGSAWRGLERALGKAGRLTGLNRLAPAYPSEYGLFVTMVKR
jgi:SAM-dependent methyltransferase